MCGCDLHLWVYQILAYSFQFDGAHYEPNLQTVFVIRNGQRWEKQTILSTIQCKNNESLPQSGNDEIVNIQEHNCEYNWYGLQFNNNI